jgi:mxaD protein
MMEEALMKRLPTLAVVIALLAVAGSAAASPKHYTACTRMARPGDARIQVYCSNPGVEDVVVNVGSRPNECRRVVTRREPGREPGVAAVRAYKIRDYKYGPSSDDEDDLRVDRMMAVPFCGSSKEWEVFDVWAVSANVKCLWALTKDELCADTATWNSIDVTKLLGPLPPNIRCIVTKTVEIKAPPAKVWAAAKDIDSLNKWQAKNELTKGKNNTVGAVRAVTIKDGPTFTEELLAFNEARHTYKYRIIESPLLNGYVATFRVAPGKDGGTHVTWSATFTLKNPADSPVEWVKLIGNAFNGGLANLKKQTEG